MRNIKFNSARVAVISAALMLAGSAFADGAATPTTSVGLAQSIDLSDAKSAGLIVVGLMVTVGVVLWGARLVLSKFKPKV